MADSTVPTTLLSRVTQIFSNLTPWSLKDLQGFPITSWNSQKDRYSILTQWYKGTFLRETVTDATSGVEVEKYPIKINPIQNTCEKHAATLFGTSLDSIRQGAMPIKFMVDPTDTKKQQVKRIETALRKVFADNNCGSTFVQDAIHSQYLGGCVWAATWLNDTKKILISSPMPDEFIGIPNGTDYYDLKEAWIIKELSEDDVKAYTSKTIPESNKKFWYVEHWTKTLHEVKINNIDIIDDTSNPFGIVPITYIPHIRVKGFIGKSIISDMVKGVVREINLREADIGDAVSEDSHNYVYVRNIRGGLKTVQIGDGRPIIDLGATAGLTGNESNPDMDAVNTTSASEPMLKFSSSLYDHYRVEVNHPAVADGVDGGSQRSSATLNARMWPLTSHAELERVFWSVGMTVFAKILLKIMTIKELNEIKEDDSEAQLIIAWSPMLPRERDAIVQEVAVRAKNKVGSRKHLIEMLGDTPDVDGELEQIRSEMDLDVVKQQPFGNNPAEEVPSTPKNTKKPKVAIPEKK